MNSADIAKTAENMRSVAAEIMVHVREHEGMEETFEEGSELAKLILLGRFGEIWPEVGLVFADLFCGIMGGAIQRVAIGQEPFEHIIDVMDKFWAQVSVASVRAYDARHSNATPHS